MDMDKLTASIQAHEGLRLTVYQDTTGNASIGYGRNLTGKGISNDEAQYLFANDLQSAVQSAQQQSWWPHVCDNDARSRACVEIIYNMGASGFGTFVDAIRCLCNDDFPGAAAALLDSQWHRQVGKRAEVIANMILTGSD